MHDIIKEGLTAFFLWNTRTISECSDFEETYIQQKLLEKKQKRCEIMVLKILVLTCLVFLPLGDGIKLGGGRGGTRGSGLNLGGGGRIRKQHTRKPGKPYFFNLLLFPKMLWDLLCLPWNNAFWPGLTPFGPLL